MERKYNTHHIIGRKNYRWAIVEDTRNKIAMLISQHRGLNSLFGENQCPHEQLECLRELYDSVLSDTAKNLFDELLELNRKDFYAKGLVKK